MPVYPGLSDVSDYLREIRSRADDARQGVLPASYLADEIDRLVAEALVLLESDR